jgi:hypothetical protein
LAHWLEKAGTTTNLEDERNVLTNSLLLWRRLALICLAVACGGLGHGQTVSGKPATALAAALPDAPQAQEQPPAQNFAPSSQQTAFSPEPPARRFAQVIEPGQTEYQFTAPDKLVFSFTEVARPFTLIPALYSASYEQLFNTDPKYGKDSGAFGEKFGAAMLRSASVRVFSDGVFAGAFHQDPRYYRIAHGSFIRRSLLSARQALVRRGDDGTEQFNYSGIAGRAVAAALVVTYYPEPSVTARVVSLTFLTSIATDAGGNWVLEFFPNMARKFPIIEKLRVE